MKSSQSNKSPKKSNLKPPCREIDFEQLSGSSEESSLSSAGLEPPSKVDSIGESDSEPNSLWFSAKDRKVPCSEVSLSSDDTDDSMGNQIKMIWNNGNSILEVPLTQSKDSDLDSLLPGSDMIDVYQCTSSPASSTAASWEESENDSEDNSEPLTVKHNSNSNTNQSNTELKYSTSFWGGSTSELSRVRQDKTECMSTFRLRVSKSPEPNSKTKRDGDWSYPEGSESKGPVVSRTQPKHYDLYNRLKVKQNNLLSESSYSLYQNSVSPQGLKRLFILENH